ncbi:MAG: formyltetrahydrofolate deformylase [Elusimicrobia bacterium RIFCSPLOWO2_02_FULL_39_32]|nr:MAG: formyltetrahydrofolate deformylase [Elusimicrobia bacterium RIFCSPHIGHO2_02_FULL_39_36]OGR93496.1 MAG: formyltetrahydrofolate deformylase [Elusimicrobia bacterium RIFCSPLOWO2_02_FULL_39_32]OGS00843.1 MAG: formyltetrahydrofolate deformylase [Elusimicrobia bacterium RIFCSPLOWO2_12_FULL_39_28]
MIKSSRTLAEITVVGTDQKGVVAQVTNFIFKAQGNIEKINQNVISGIFGMHCEASFQKEKLSEEGFRVGLKDLGKSLKMEIKVHFDEPSRLKNMAVFVTREPHCLETILKAKKKGEIKVNIPLLVGTEKTLQALAKKEKNSFFTVTDKDQSQAEMKILSLLERFNIDFIVLARYMRILTPNFVWRYPNRIINVHPSILPAFPGAFAYAQAYERGAQIVGCTAHFVTEDLDQGPIIWQESFRVKQNDPLDTIRAKGQAMEEQTLLKAIKLYLQKGLEVYWGKVHFKKN